ncbi:MAG: ATP-dependent DNA helicase DinG, partial [Delftia sp.]|nr:ATP-dependent DNA helicase DinG [Delftia sp.]
RWGQRQMIAEVANALADPEAETPIAVVEAGTGTGKTIAYLVAALPVARARGKKLVVASATVALQEQLLFRDLPDVMQHSGLNFDAALAKGRGRYLCPRNLAMARNSMNDSGQMGLAGFDADLALWAKPPQPRDKQALAQLGASFDSGEWNGDMDSAPEPVSDLLRPMLTTSAGGCTNRKCGFFMTCPFFSARRAVEDAEIIVANQDLVLADLTLPGEDEGWGGVILPRPDETLYIFDEGHHVPGKAIDRRASEVFMNATVRQLSR